MKISKKILDTIKVLHIEDDDAIIKLVKKQLNTADNTKFKYVAKANLNSGIDYIKEMCNGDEYCSSIDVILLDLILPNSSGVATFLKLKEISRNIPIVIVSAHEDIACECVSLGAQDYLIKPDIPSTVLIRSLKYAIQRNNIEQLMTNVITKSTLGYHLYELQDDKLIFTGYNPAADRLLKRDHKKCLNKCMREAFPTSPDEVYNSCERALIKEEPWLDQIVPFQDEFISATYFRINAYKTGPNQLAITFEDITKLVHQSAALKESELKYRTLVEVTGACIFGIDFKENKFTYANDVFCDYLDYTKDELINNINIIDTLTEESKLTYRERRLALKMGRQIPSTCDYHIVRKDGSTLWIFSTSEYIEDSDGNVIGANVVAININKKKEKELKTLEKEHEVYVQLEKQMTEWNEEMTNSAAKKEKVLKLIDDEILTMRESF